MTNKKLKISLDDILQGFIDETEKMVDELKQEKDREINELRIEKDKEINKIIKEKDKEIEKLEKKNQTLRKKLDERLSPSQLQRLIDSKNTYKQKNKQKNEEIHQMKKKFIN